MNELAAAPAASRVKRNLPWMTCLVVGILLWLGSLIITDVTNDPILIPTVILLGSFVVPLTVVVFALSRKRADRLPPMVMFLGFIAGGTIGVLCSALLETYYLPHGKGTYLSVGLIEEAAKALVVVAVAHQVIERGPRDGMVLGAIVGAGFAAFETSGYALSTLLKHMDDHGILNVANTELTRGILAPFGHVLWTALVGGALFESAQRTGAFRLTSRLLWTFVGVVVLHGAWDASYGVAIVFTRGIVGQGWEFSLAGGRRLDRHPHGKRPARVPGGRQRAPRAERAHRHVVARPCVPQLLAAHGTGRRPGRPSPRSGRRRDDGRDRRALSHGRERGHCRHRP